MSCVYYYCNQCGYNDLLEFKQCPVCLDTNITRDYDETNIDKLFTLSDDNRVRTIFYAVFYFR